MKSPNQLIALLFIGAALLVTNSCQEDTVLQEQPEVDDDMATAIQLIDIEFPDLLGSDNDRRTKWKDSKRCITVLKYQKGKKGNPGQLMFDTNRDNYEGFQPIDELTVTAVAEPGEYVFWYRGGGLKYLKGIEFEPASEAMLDDLPSDFREDRIWYVQMPELIPDGTELKYDILYQLKKSNEIIRLDPKLRAINNN